MGRLKDLFEVWILDNYRKKGVNIELSIILFDFVYTWFQPTVS